MCLIPGGPTMWGSQPFQNSPYSFQIVDNPKNQKTQILQSNTTHFCDVYHLKAIPP